MVSGPWQERITGLMSLGSAEKEMDGSEVT